MKIMKGVNLRYTKFFSVCFLILIFLIVSAPAYADNASKLKPGAKGKICLKCHESYKETLKSRYVHPLLKTGECTGCHVPHTSSHKNLLTASTAELCYNCHKKVLPENALSAHEVVVEANCNKCHAYHGSNNKFILNKSGNDLCIGCHKDIGDKVKNARFKHRSLDKGRGCLNCHNPHASVKSNHLLQTEVPALCKKCHKTEKLTFKRKHMNYPVADSNCSSCHSPHGSNKRGNVFDIAHAAVYERKCDECHQKPTSLKTKKKGTELCRQCHKDMVRQAFDKKRVHSPLIDSVGCLNCHNPHATKQDKLLQGSTTTVCGKCHSDTVELQKWSINNPKNKKLCEPVKKGNCIACHSPHSSDNILLMAQPSVDTNVCGRCHDWESHSTHPIGEKVIDQRNKNLTVGCLSCHRGCGTGNNPAMLTFSTTYELCIQCHTDRKR